MTEPLIFWSLTYPQPTTTGGATITNGATTSRSGFGAENLKLVIEAVIAQYEPSVRKAVEELIKLEVWVKIDAMPDMQREADIPKPPVS